MNASLSAMAWAQLWQVTLLCVTIAAIIRLACRQRPFLAYLLWMLLIVKAITPPLWSSELGFFSWVQPRLAPAAASPRGDADASIRERLTSRDQFETGEAPPRAHLRGEAISVKEYSWSAPQTLLGIWLAGVAVLAGVVAVKWIRWELRLRRTSAPAGQAIQQTVARLARQLGLRRVVEVRTVAAPDGPALHGWLRPVVLLPDPLIASSMRDQLELILAHELVHVRRADALAGRIQLAVQILWWFHPLIWWANRQIRRERERCADQEVVAGLACHPPRYAAALLDAEELLGPLRHRFAAAGVYLSNINVQRVEEIMQRSHQFKPRTPRAYWLVAALAAVVILPGRGLTVQDPSGNPNSAATQAAGQDDAARQREQIGESLGKPVYRDEIRTKEGVSLPSELHRLFTSAAIQEYREQHKDDITPTPTEIAAATKHYDEKHRELMREQEPSLQAKLKAIDEKLAAVDLQDAEKGKLSIKRRVIQKTMTPPGESFATFALKNLKFQRHLYLKYGGGRILFQQAGLESFDATRKWLESLEEAGKFKITDPKLRSVFYHYYTGQDHGPFLSRNEERIREITEPKWLEQPKPQK